MTVSVPRKRFMIKEVIVVLFSLCTVGGLVVPDLRLYVR